MIDERTAKTKLAELLMTDTGPSEQQIAHREGRIRGIVFVLTGQDVGYGCGTFAGVKQICDWLGWKCQKCGDGWEIDWHDEVDEAALTQAGVEIVPKTGK